MRKQFIILTGMFVLSSSLLAQKDPEMAPLNPDFTNYFKDHSDSGNKSKTGYKLNYIPAPLSIQPKVSSSPGSNLKSATIIDLPAVYDLRKEGQVTGVRAQGDGIAGGNCWAFATMAAIESNWLKFNYGNFDLSESNMITCHGYERGFGDGGNEFLAQAYLTTFKGPVSEQVDPYNLTAFHACVSYPILACVPESRMVFGTQILIKQIIMDYGAVYSVMRFDTNSYNATNYTFNYQGNSAPNHGIAIVGWDDTKKYSGGTGVWICKNSWGPNWGESGYFYIGYKDKKVANPVVYYPSRWGKWSVSKLYYYDELGTVTTFGYNKPVAYALVKFTTSKPQYIKKIGTFVSATGSLIDIDIYGAKDGDTLKNLLASAKNLLCRSAGFYTFDIPVQVNGDFYVKVKYFCPSIKYPMPIEMKVDLDGTPYTLPHIESSGKEWCSNDGITWKAMGSDVKGFEADLSIRAYAVDDLGPKANFKMDKWEVCHDNSITFTDQSVGNITNYEWSFGTDAVPSTATGAGPHTVTFSSSALAGLRHARLIVSGPDGRDTIIKEYKVVTGLDAVVVSSLADVKISDTTQLMAVGDGTSFKWTPSTNLSSDTGKTVIFHSGIPATYSFTLNIAQGSCTGSVHVEVDVLKPPVNDDECNAIQLHLGENGPFSNLNATVQYQEPSPVDTCCTCDRTWCDEGGLQNSVWFKFDGTSSGITSIDTKGFDSQIAVYNSSSCSNISDNDLIAANDDFHSEEDFFAACLNLVPVTAGKSYFLQLDGSAGGDTCSNFYIYLYDGPVGVNKVLVSNKLRVLPNPNFGAFNLIYSSPVNEELNILSYDMTGRLIKEKSAKKEAGDLNVPMDLNDQPAGFYLIKVIGEKGTITQKILKK